MSYQVRQIFWPRSNSALKKVHSHSKHTMNKRSLVIIDANARANPAVEALMFGVTRYTKLVAPTKAAESRLKRIESHRFTTTDGESTAINSYLRTDLPDHTSPHPVVRVGVLPSIWAYVSIGLGIIGKPCRHSGAYHARTLSKLQKHELLLTPAIVSP